MTKTEIYQAWAPTDSTWSPWAKPVLFAHVQSTPSPESEAPLELAVSPPWVPTTDGTNAIVVDLPGVDGVLFGLALAQSGYRPIPLFNSVPAPSGASLLNVGPSVVVDMQQVMSALVQGASMLQPLGQAPTAPPAFLLDSRRRGLNVSLMPQMFDNRSISLPTDFPSANFMLSAGIQRVLVVQTHSNMPQEDLCHTLRRWQEAGISIFVDSLTDPVAPVPVLIHRPPSFRHMWYGLLARFGLRRNPLGGFGGFIPVPGSAG